MAVSCPGVEPRPQQQLRLFSFAEICPYEAKNCHLQHCLANSRTFQNVASTFPVPSRSKFTFQDFSMSWKYFTKISSLCERRGNPASEASQLATAFPTTDVASVSSIVRWWGTLASVVVRHKTHQTEVKMTWSRHAVTTFLYAVSPRWSSTQWTFHQRFTAV